MDPLSVTAAIVGLLATGAKVSSSLWGFIGGVKQAPSMVYDLLDELHEIRTYLTQLQSLVPELELESRPRAALIMIDHVVITLTASVMNFSKLEEIVDSIVVTGEPINAHGRIRWVKKEQNIRVILHRLHSSNTSLHCMLTILTCMSVEQALSSSKKLSTQVQQVMESNQDIQARIASTRAQSIIPGSGEGSSNVVATMNDDNSTIRRPTARVEDNNVGVKVQNPYFGFTFDNDLYASRVYRRAMRKPNRDSLTSSAIFSVGWSFLSGLSLGEISHVTVLALPISREEFWNPEHYSVLPEVPLNPEISPKPHMAISQIGTAISTPEYLLLIVCSQNGKATILGQLENKIGCRLNWSSRAGLRDAIYDNLRNLLLKVVIEMEAIRYMIKSKQRRAGLLLDSSAEPLIFSRNKPLRAISCDLQNSIEHVTSLELHHPPKANELGDGLKIPPIMPFLERLHMAGAFMCSLSPLCSCIRMPSIFVTNSYKTNPIEVSDHDISKRLCFHKEETYVIFVAALPELTQYYGRHESRPKFDSAAFDEIFNLKEFQTVSVLICITRLELYALELPRMESFMGQTDSEEAKEWTQAAHDYAKLFSEKHRRLHGKLQFHINDQLDDDAFTTTLRQLQVFCANDPMGGIYPVGGGSNI